MTRVDRSVFASLRTVAVVAAAIGAAAIGAAAAPLHAQDYESAGVGTYLITGTGWLGSSDGVSMFGVHPGAGYFVRSGLALMAEAGVERYSGFRGTAHVIGVGPGAQYYLRAAGSRLMPYVMARVLLAWTQSTDAALEAATRGPGVILTGGGGLTARLTSTLGVTAQVELEAGRKRWVTPYWDGANTAHRLVLALGGTLFLF